MDYRGHVLRASVCDAAIPFMSLISAWPRNFELRVCASRTKQLLCAGTFDKHALHGGCPVRGTKDQKFVATKWLRDKGSD